MQMVSKIGVVLMVLQTVSCSMKDGASRLETIENFESKLIRSRKVQIYLPPSYDNSNKSYAVLYMHDGQMLYDSTSTWNGQEWGVDETMDRLIKEGKIVETIVVGVDNGDELRHSEYFPQKPFESLEKSFTDSLYEINRNTERPLFASKVQSDQYLKFIVEELKPYIDKTYRTQPVKQNTFVAGSSMGGLISMYAICEYPEVFGGAICMSTHWPGIFTAENNPIPQAFFSYLKENLPDPQNHKLYFDYGTETLDAMYEPFQLEADQIIRDAGFNDSNFWTKKFEGEAHTEIAWQKRFHIPLTFNLAK